MNPKTNTQQPMVRALFESESELIGAAKLLRRRGCRNCECYAPNPVDAIDAIWRRPRSKLPRIAFVAGLVGAIAGYGMQHYAMAMNYPHNVGGRPLVSWPLFLPITFEVMVLAAAWTSFAALLVCLRLPKLHQPVLDSPLAARVNQDRYLLEAIPGAAAINRHGPEKAASDLAAALAEAGAVQTEIVDGEGSLHA